MLRFFYFHSSLSIRFKSTNAAFLGLSRPPGRQVTLNNYTDYQAVYFSGFLFWGCHGQVGGTRFQVGMTVDIIPVLCT